MKIVAIDPGGEVGWATYEMEGALEFRLPEVGENETAYDQFVQAHPVNKETWKCGQFGKDEPHHWQLFKFLRGHLGQNVVFICESYEIAPTGSPDHHFAVEDIGVVKLFEQVYYDSVRIVWQGAQLQSGKAIWTVPALKKLRVYKPAQPHAMSATKHILHYLTNKLARVDIYSRLR